MRFGTLLISLLFAGELCLAAGAPVHVDGARFRTGDGHQILLRGINVSGNAKVPPFRGVRGDEDFAPLRGWGFNSVRLLFNWEAFEPEPGVYDEDYLRFYTKMIEAAGRYQLLTVVDIHQDGFSRFSIGGCGEGFPKWALPPSVTPAEPDNGAACSNWGVRMLFDIPMHASWHHFYRNTHGVRDRFLLMIERLAQAVAGSPHVIGFDVLNEPWGLERSELPDLYRDAGERIQKIMPGAVLFLTPHALSSAGVFPSKLARIDLPNVVHAPHFYDPGLTIFQGWTAFALDTAHGHWKKALESWRSPMYLGEFGAPMRLKTAADYIDAIYDLMDRELYSGAQWVYTPAWNEQVKDGWNAEDFSINDAAGRLRGTYRPRPFVETTPGDLLSMRWDGKLSTLTLTYAPTLAVEKLGIAVPAHLQWIGVRGDMAASDCVMQEAHRLQCEPMDRKEQRTLTLLFQAL